MGASEQFSDHAESSCSEADSQVGSGERWLKIRLLVLFLGPWFKPFLQSDITLGISDAWAITFSSPCSVCFHGGLGVSFRLCAAVTTGHHVADRKAQQTLTTAFLYWRRIENLRESSAKWMTKHMLLGRGRGSKMSQVLTFHVNMEFYPAPLWFLSPTLWATPLPTSRGCFGSSAIWTCLSTRCRYLVRNDHSTLEYLL